MTICSRDVRVMTFVFKIFQFWPEKENGKTKEIMMDEEMDIDSERRSRLTFEFE